MDPEQHARRKLSADALDLLDERLPPSELRTVLLGVARSRAAASSPADVLRRWRQDRFVRPATTDPRRLAAVEARVWALLPDVFAGVELSPVAPLGTVSTVTGTSQDRVVTTTRLTEVVSDTTNVLAVEAAARRMDGADEVHLAACQRQLRGQDFGAGSSSHFRLLCLVSSARRPTADLLTLHLSAWIAVLGGFVPAARPQLRVTLFGDAALAERWHDTVLPALPAGAVDVREDPERSQGRDYYTGVSFKLVATDPLGAEVELGDGGATGWTARLLGDAKERCLVSCIATERLAGLS